MQKKLSSIAVDIGASSGRVMLGKYDGNAIKLTELHRFTNTPVYTVGTLYWDILSLYKEMKYGLNVASKNTGISISSIGIDTWGNDFGLLDNKGKLLGNPVHYRDNRTEGMMEKVFARVSKWDIYQQTGIQFMRVNGLYQLFSMVNKNDPVMEIAEKILTIPDLLVYFITGEAVSEFTNASTMQLFNSSKYDWAYELIHELGISGKIFPQVVKPGTILSKLSKDVLDYPPYKNTQVVSVAQHDTGSAVAAIPASIENFVYISSGTWSLMGVEVKNPIINEKTFQFNFTNEGGVFDTFRLLKNVMGLWILQECKRGWDLDEGSISFAELETLGYASKPFKCFIDPDDERFISPGNMPAKITDFCYETGQDLPANKGEFIRCIMESLALKYRYVLEMIEQITNKNYEAIHIVGGGAKDRMLCEFTADSTSRKVVAGPSEATAAGNLLMQLAALGEIHSLSEVRQIARNSFLTEEYTPKNHCEWDRAYDKFLKFI